MTVGELRKLIEGADDDMQVLIPLTQEFDGAFYSPCSHDSGVSQMGTDNDLTEEDIKEMELLNKPIPEVPALLLIPCGFGEEKDHTHELN
jgi:hypothetical protein